MGGRTMLAAGLGLLLAACGGGPGVDTGVAPSGAPAFAEYRTYGWIQDTRQQADPLTSARIVTAVDNQLALKGLRKLADGAPDFRVAYHLAYQGPLDPAAAVSALGYGTGTVSARTGTSGGSWPAGTLVVDVVDGSRNELVWRAATRAEILPGATPQERGERINEAVVRLLAGFPPR